MGNAAVTLSQDSEDLHHFVADLWLAMSLVDAPTDKSRGIQTTPETWRLSQYQPLLERSTAGEEVEPCRDECKVGRDARSHATFALGL